MKTNLIAVRLPKEMDDALKALAQKKLTDKSSVIRQLLKDGIEKEKSGAITDRSSGRAN